MFRAFGHAFYAAVELIGTAIEHRGDNIFLSSLLGERFAHGECGVALFYFRLCGVFGRSRVRGGNRPTRRIVNQLRVHKLIRPMDR